MKVVECHSCGANDLYEENGYMVCNYCGTRHLITADDKPGKESVITLPADVSFLLKKCKEQPERAKKLAERILEIDPNNEEAKKILGLDKSSGGCYVATAVYGSYDCPQVWTLRRYRDYTLAGTWYGRAFIRTYYAVSPTLVKRFGNKDWFRRLWQPKLDRMVKRLNSEGVENTPYADRNW
ncbi:MAG: TFIIB-type zinc finger domain-containing protein [Firmicutes bacterium]|nr:TFIIB-type zinc finger domain-containing protein [Bacillota bacterium]